MNKKQESIMNLKYTTWAVVMLLLLAACGRSGSGEEQAISVRVSLVGQSADDEGTSYSGTIEAQTSTSLSFASMGTISSMYAKEGMTVSKGQVLATLDGNTQQNLLLTAQAAKDLSQESLSQAEDAYARMKMLHDAGSITDMQWVDVETKLAQAQASVRAAEAQVAIAEKGVADTRLVAPFSGYVSQKMADVGLQVAPGVPIFSLVNIDQVKAKFSVPESEISNIRVGEPMTIGVSTLPTALFEGTVCEKSVAADPLSRSYDVWLLLTNTGHGLLPGMLCEVKKTSVDGGETVMIEARRVLLNEKNERFVWLMKDGKATRQFITTGANVGRYVVVSSGLSVGDSLITDGSQKVYEGARCVVDKN